MGSGSLGRLAIWLVLAGEFIFWDTERRSDNSVCPNAISEITSIVPHSALVFGISFVGLWIAAVAGAYLHKGNSFSEASPRVRHHPGGDAHAPGVADGFSFSMAGNRYDQRKNLEAAEANAIGTAFLRADRRARASPANCASC